MPATHVMRQWPVVLILLSVIPLGANRVWAWTGLFVIVALNLLIGLIVSKRLYPSLLHSLASQKAAASLLTIVLVWGLLQPYALHWYANAAQLTTAIVDTELSSVFVLRLTLYFWVFLLGCHISSSRSDTDRAVRLIAVFTALMSVVALISLAADLEFLKQFKSEENFQRASGTFVNQNSYALYAVFGLIINLSLFLKFSSDVRDRIQRGRSLFKACLQSVDGLTILIIIGVVGNFAALIATGSRAGMMSGILGVITFLLLRFLGTRERAARFFLLLALPLGFLLVAVAFQVLARHYFGTGHDNLRWSLYVQTIAMIQDHWLMGVGWGHYETGFLQYRTADLSWLTWDYAHNSYLEMAAELGLPAAILFYIAISIVLWSILKGAIAKKFARSLPSIVLACSVSAAAHSLLDFPLQMPANASLYALMMGLAWGRLHPFTASRS